jgi:hypothetical protein
MTVGPEATGKLGLREAAPTGWRALAFGGGWIVVAVVATWGAVRVAIDWSSTGARIAVALALLAVSTAALMLASASLERVAAERFRRWDGRLQWLTTSFVALAVVIIGGAASSSVVADRPGIGHVAAAFGFDFVLGVLAGGFAVCLILAASGLLGTAIVWGHHVLHLEARARLWVEGDDESPSLRDDEPVAHGARYGRARRIRHQLLRGIVIGAAGLLLSGACTAVVTALSSNRASGPDTPATLETHVFWTVWLPVLVWFAATAGVWALFARTCTETARTHPQVRHGTRASALAVALVLAVGWVTAGSVAGGARAQLTPAHQWPVPAPKVTKQQWSSGSPYLARMFEPELRLARGEHWHPTSVAWYVGQTPRPPNTDGPFCDEGPAPPAGCHEIKPPPSCDDPDPGPCAPSGADAPALYYRYIDASDDPGDMHPTAAFGDWVVIQYWFFYNYDSLHTWAVTQWHQSDWEQVSVLLRRAGTTVTPFEVAFSEHCYGARQQAARVQWNGSRPVVYVAAGSHANYPSAVDEPVRQLRCSLGVIPRYVGVAGLFFSPAIDGSRLEIPAAYLLGLRDETNDDRSLPRLRLIALDRTTAVESFHGAWGLDNNLSFGPLQLGRLRASAGPPAPEEQETWMRPFASMFCDPRWLSASAEPSPETCGDAGS